jgi:predicted protein tyrosine phosphatase
LNPLRIRSRAAMRSLTSVVLRLKRIDSFPDSAMWWRWVSRSSGAVVIFVSPNTPDHSTKSRLVAIVTLVRPHRRLRKWNGNAPPAWLKGE